MAEKNRRSEAARDSEDSKPGERPKYGSSARTRRDEQRGSGHLTQPQTTNQALKTSFGIQDDKVGSSRGYHSLGGVGRGRGKITLTSTANKPGAPNVVASESSQKPATLPPSGKPSSQRPNNMFVTTKKNGDGRGSKVTQGSKVNTAPLRAPSNPVNEQPIDSQQNPPLESHDLPRPLAAVPPGTARSHENIPRSPADSDHIPSGNIPSMGTTDTHFPFQVSEGTSEGSKVVTGDHPSLVGDPETIRMGGISKQISVASTASSASDRMIGTEHSFPVVAGGAIGLLESSLRRQVEELRTKLADRDEEVKVLQALVDSNVEKLAPGEVGEIPMDSGDFPLEGDGEEQNMGGAKLLTNRSSLVTDEKGNHVPGRRKSKQEQDLFMKCENLKAQMVIKETEIESLFQKNSRLEQTITDLQATVKQGKSIYRRGYSNKDMEQYIDQVENLTKQMSEIEEREHQLRLKNAELETKLSVVPKLTNHIKVISKQRDEAKRNASHLATEFKEYKARSASSDQTPDSQDSMDLRVISLEASKVPELKQEISSLKKELADARERAASQTDEKLVEKITEVSVKDEEIRKLREELKLAATLGNHGNQDTDSEAYQILLQESAGKDEQIKQLESAICHKQLEVEVKVQEVHAQLETLEEAKVQAETELREKLAENDGLQAELKTLKLKFEKSEKLNKNLRARVAQLTVPTATGEEGSHITETPQQTERPKLSDGDSRKLRKAVSEMELKIKELNAGNDTKDKKIEELEGILKAFESERDLQSDVAERDGKIQELESKLSALESAEPGGGQKSVEEVLSQKQSLILYSKKQSKQIASLKTQLEESEKSCAQFQNMVENLSKEKESSALKFKRVSAEKIMLEERSKKQEGSQTAALATRRLEADLTRMRGERDQLREELSKCRQETEMLRKEMPMLTQVQSDYVKLKEAFTWNQQKLIAQQATIDNKTSELNALKKEREALKGEKDAAKETGMSERAALARITHERDDLKTQLEVMHQQSKMFEEDFVSERKDREAAHSKYADLERKYDHQTTHLANELQVKSQETQVANQVNRELKENIKTMEADLQDLTRELSLKESRIIEVMTENGKLKEEIKSKTQQVKHYQRQTDQFKNQFEVSAENSDYLKAQVESSTSRTDQLERANKKLTAENQNMSAKIRHLEATRGSSVDKKLEEKVDELTVQNVMLQSEIEQLKKGVASHPTQPTRATDHNVSHRAQMMQQQLLPNPVIRAPASPYQRPPLQPSRHYLRGDGKSPSADDANLSSRGQEFGFPGTHTIGLQHPNPQTLGVSDQRRQSRTADLGRKPVVRQERVPLQPGGFTPPLPSQPAAPSKPNKHPPYMNMEYKPYMNLEYNNGAPTSLPPSIGSPQGHRQEVGVVTDAGDRHQRSKPPGHSDYMHFRPPYAGVSHNTQPPRLLSPESEREHRLTVSEGPYRHHGQPGIGDGGYRHPHSSYVGQPHEASSQPRPPAGTRHTSQGTFPPPPSNAGRDSQTDVSASSGYSIQLDKGIDEEIHLEAQKLARQGSGDVSLPVEDDSTPFDPFLVCPTCGRQFRIGEIQKFKRHADSCGK